MKKKNYRLEQFDDFLLAIDKETRDIGWIMVYSSFKVDNMDLDTLSLLKVELSNRKYYPEILQFNWWKDKQYYSNEHCKLLIKAIDERLTIFNSSSKRTAFYKAKRLVRDEGNAKIDKTGEVRVIKYA